MKRGIQLEENDFKHLMNLIKNAYVDSDISKHCQKENLNWSYSICSTKIVPNNPLIVGFNWGAEDSISYQPQEIPSKSFEGIYNDLGSFKRVVPFLKEYISDDVITTIGQTNYCFFRSKIESQITENDLILCRPIFMELLILTKPKYLLVFSSRLRKYLTSLYAFSIIDSKQCVFYRGKNRTKVVFDAIKGKLKIDGSHKEIIIYILPHPNYPIKKEARRKAWEIIKAIK